MVCFVVECLRVLEPAALASHQPYVAGSNMSISFLIWINLRFLVLSTLLITYTTP